MSGLGRVGRVDPGVRAHEAVAGAADEHAALCAQDLARLVEHHLDGARVAVAARPPARARALAGLTSASATTAPSALETDLVRDRHAPVRRAATRRLGRAQRRSAPRGRRPARTSGRPVRLRTRRGLPQRAPLSSCQRRSCAGQLGPAERVAGAQGPRADAPRGARAAPRGPRRCRCRAAARPAARSRHAAPAARASSRWRSQLPGPKLGAITSGGVSSRPFVPVPWRSGTITTSARARRSPFGERLACCSSARAPPGRARGSRRGRTARARSPPPAPL